MKTFHIDDLVFSIGIKGETRYGKASYPVRYGIYSEVATRDAVFHFNLNGEIKHVRLKDTRFMEPTEWLKRTVGNDWVFYSSGGYNGAFEAVGEYYVPCFLYESNGILGGKPFKSGLIDHVGNALSDTIRQMGALKETIQDPEQLQFFRSILSNTDGILEKKAITFHETVGGVVSVLPPDARHVDYDVIPVQIVRGCLYNCGFCSVKSGKGFSKIPMGEIESNISKLKRIYGEDLRNYNSLFLGQHDALNAGSEWIERASLKAYSTFGFHSSVMASPRLFMFGSADSFLSAEDSLFDMMNKLPFDSYVNIGLESPDELTLKKIGKPISKAKVKEGFSKMAYVNRTYPRIEVTANFLYGESLPSSHMDELYQLIQDQYTKSFSKGAVY
jgi:hypothetical protein